MVSVSDRGLGRLAIKLKLKIRKFWWELDPLSDDYDTSNLRGQKNLTYELSALDKA